MVGVEVAIVVGALDGIGIYGWGIGNMGGSFGGGGLVSHLAAVAVTRAILLFLLLVLLIIVRALHLIFAHLVHPRRRRHDGVRRAYVG